MNKHLKVLLGFVLALFCVGGVTLAASEFKADNIISHSGGAVAFPGGITTPTTAIGDLHSSTYTATAAVGTNVDSIANPTLSYVSIGGAVAVYGTVSLNTTTDDTAGAFTLTLPFTRASNFSGTGEASGAASSNSIETGSCSSTNAAKTVTCKYYADGTGTQAVQVMFLYDKT